MKDLNFEVSKQFENLSILKEVGKINYCAPNQVVTHFPINAGGRTLLIGIDYNPLLAKERSIHTVVCNGTHMESDGWSVTGDDRNVFIDSALRQVRKMLELVIPE